MELECEICYCPFDDDETRARVLPCAHSYCENCIDNNLKKERRSCPACRKSFSIDSAKELPANYALEKLLQKALLLRNELEVEKIDDFNLGICPKHKCNRLYFVCKGKYYPKDDDDHVSGPICRDCSHLDHQHCVVKSVEDDLKELRNSRTEDANECIETSEIRLDGLRMISNRYSEEIKDKEEMVRKMLEDIEELNKKRNRVEQAESLIKERVCALKDSKCKLENSSTRNEISEACKDVLNKIHKVEPHLDDIDMKYDLDLSFGQELLAIQPKKFVKTMKGLKERSMYGKTMQQRRCGTVFAVANIGDDEYGAKLFINEDEVHMEGLIKNNPQPPCSEVVSAFRLHSLLPEHPKVYMTLSLNEDILGTIYIDIAPETSTKNNYGKQFLALFTGSLGPSYRGVNIGGKGYDTLYTVNYMKPDGTQDNVKIVSDFNYGSATFYKEKGRVFSHQTGGFQIFHINGRGCYNTVYGTVTSGMEVIESISNESAKDVLISNVGVVLG